MAGFLLSKLSMRYLTFILILAVLPSFGQVKKGDKKFKKGEYNSAIDYYRKDLDDRSKGPRANFMTGECYRVTNRIKEAENYYKAAIDSGYPDETAILWYTQALKANGEYKKAKTSLEKYLASGSDEVIIARATNELENIEHILTMMEENNYYRVRNLSRLNSSGAEYSPVYNDENLYFTSNRYGGKTYKAIGSGFTNIYKAETEGALVDSTTIESIGKDINLPGVNSGSVTFSRDGKTMVFARGNSGKRKGTYDVNLYISRLRNREWSEPRILNISIPDAWDSCPTFSADGRTLYFASNREGGYGGTDLYSARMDSRGRFAKPRNLGPVINTAGNETFPYVSDDGHLYFSSDGHPSFGQLDIFVAKRINGQLSITNLGLPINSEADDFAFYLYKPDRGFFSSNRSGGKGDDDIYTFVNNDPDLKVVNYYLRGITKSHDTDGTEIVLPNVRVELRDFKGEVLDDVLTGSDGNFQFRVYEHERYQLVADKVDSKNYFKTRLDYTTVGRSIPQEDLVKLVTNVTFDTLIYLERIEVDKVFVLEDIYYDFDRWEIRPDAAIELDKLVNVLLDNPSIKIELSSHTDSVGADGYNERLSQRRAESAVEYIIDAGIERERLVAKGYGESRPIARNTNPDGTDNPEGRQKNRRTEFKILEVDTSKLKEKSDDEFDEDRFFDEDSEDLNENE